MRPFNNNNQKLPINHLWGIVELAKDGTEQRIFPTDIYRTRKQARNALKTWKTRWKLYSRFLSVRKLHIDV